MNTIGILTVLLLALMTAALWAAYLIYRDYKVYDFRAHIISLCADFSRRHIMEIAAGYGVPDPYDKFLHKHAYGDMVFSLRPLRLEAWFTEDEIRELMS